MIPSITQYYPNFDSDLQSACANLEVSPTLTESMQYSLKAGGKRIRPLLALVTCSELGGDISQSYPIALALEAVHTYSLIHDDLPCMDDDDLRRGQPTNHKVYGEAHAILSGDGLLTLAFQILSNPLWNVSAETKLKVIQIIAHASGSSGMVGGQALDLESENKKITAQQLQSIHVNKTGKLINASVMAGAIVATDNPTILDAISTFGQSIGLAFQVADDILDLTQTSETLGKNAGSDLEKNKATYPSLLGIEEAQQKLQDLYQKSIRGLNLTGHPCNHLQAIAEFIIQRTS